MKKQAKKATVIDLGKVSKVMAFPKEHRAKLYSTNPIERLNGESAGPMSSASSPTKPASPA